MADTEPPKSGDATPFRCAPRFHHRGDEAQLSRLRDERDRVAGVARCARRPQAGAPAHSPLDERAGPYARQEIRQIGARGRRRDGQISPARRPGDLRRAGAHGAGLLHAPDADRRAGQFRLGRRRSAGGDALHRMPPGAAGDGAARRHRQGHRRLPGQLRRQRDRAGGAAGALSEFAGQRRRRHRGRHGDEYPAAQSRRGDRCGGCAHRQSGAHHRRPDQDRPGPGFSDRRHHPRPRRHPLGLQGRPRLDRDARQGRDRDHPQGARSLHHHGNSRTR